MLVRSTSSRRRRASRSAASSPQTRMISGTRSAATSPGRRASIAVSPVDGNRGLLPSEINRSPRHSIIPDISLMESRDDHGRDDFDIEIGHKNRSPRHSLVPEKVLSPRNSLVPDITRSPRHSLVPNDQRSPRNSLVPDSTLSPRNSLTPDQYNSRSPRNSLIPDQNRTPRHSLTPESNVYGSRLSISEASRSPRNSLLPDGTRPTRPVVTSESTTWNDETNNRPSRLASPRGSIAPETMISRTSPRGSITSEFAHDQTQRSPRGSIGPENGCDIINRSPRGSIAPTRSNMASDMRSSRGSLTLTFQEPPLMSRRSSADNPQGSRVRTTSPSCRSSKGNITTGYNNSGVENSGSRRASSSVSQMSGDEQRRLCADQKYLEDGGQTGIAIGLSLTTYGSVAYQLKDANLEASGTCDFVCKALQIVNKTSKYYLVINGIPSVKTGIAIGLSITTYGSVAYRLKDANLEASGTCDFVCKALQIVNKTSKYYLVINGIPSVKTSIAIGLNLTTYESVAYQLKYANLKASGTCDLVCKALQIVNKTSKYYLVINGIPSVKTGIAIGLNRTTYDSVAYQLKDANLEASGTCDFVCKALRIVNKTSKYYLVINGIPSVKPGIAIGLSLTTYGSVAYWLKDAILEASGTYDFVCKALQIVNKTSKYYLLINGIPSVKTGITIGLSRTTYDSMAYQLKDANLEARGTCDFLCKALQIVNKTSKYYLVINGIPSVKTGIAIGLSLTTYGSVANQLKDTNLEASGTCDFVCKALQILNKTIVVTILLACLSVLPLIMLIMGIQFLRDCPREPNIPIYMVVGGGVGCIKMALTLWNQLHGRRVDVGSPNGSSIGSKVASIALTLLLIIWFGLGNYWILKIKWPDYAPTLYEPNRWCHRTLYVFSLVQLCIIYSLLAMVVVLVIVLTACQLFGCHWLGPTRYK